jgi:proteasome accessory factor B
VADALERITNLLALLLNAKQPLTTAQIYGELAEFYTGHESAKRTAFERDKAVLRAEGVPIEQVVLGGDQAGQTAYRVDPRRYELGDLGLLPDEQQALNLAVATVRMGAGWGEEALWKVDATGTAGADVTTVGAEMDAGMPSLPLLPPLFEACSERRPVLFTYRGVARRLEPYALLSRAGFWYLVGLDVAHHEVRTYRVDRIDGDVTLGEGSFERPEGFDARSVLPTDAKAMGDDGSSATTALVLIDRTRAAGVEQELGSSALRERRDDGSVVVEVPCANDYAFRAWLLGLLDHAEVLEPAAVRGAFVAWLTSMTEAP